MPNILLSICLYSHCARILIYFSSLLSNVTKFQITHTNNNNNNTPPSGSVQFIIINSIYFWHSYYTIIIIIIIIFFSSSLREISKLATFWKTINEKKTKNLNLNPSISCVCVCYFYVLKTFSTKTKTLLPIERHFLLFFSCSLSNFALFYV